MAKDYKNTFSFIFFVLAGIVLGAFIAHICDGRSFVDWLSWGQSIGFDPVTFDLSILKFTLGFKINVSVAQIFCIAIMLIVNSRLRRG